MFKILGINHIILFLVQATVRLGHYYFLCHQGCNFLNLRNNHLKKSKSKSSWNVWFSLQWLAISCGVNSLFFLGSDYPSSEVIVLDGPLLSSSSSSKLSISFKGNSKDFSFMDFLVWHINGSKNVRWPARHHFLVVFPLLFLLIPRRYLE